MADPISIIGTVIAITTAVIKTTIVVTDLAQNNKEASKDLIAVAKELRGLSAILDPLSRGFSQVDGETLQPDLVQSI